MLESDIKSCVSSVTDHSTLRSQDKEANLEHGVQITDPQGSLWLSRGTLNMNYNKGLSCVVHTPGLVGNFNGDL